MTSLVTFFLARPEERVPLRLSDLFHLRFAVLFCFFGCFLPSLQTNPPLVT